MGRTKLETRPTDSDRGAACIGKLRRDTQPAGREFVAVNPVAAPLEVLRGSVMRYDNPTDPVWFDGPDSD